LVPSNAAAEHRRSAGRQELENMLHITSGDRVGESLAKAGLPGEVFVWHDILYDGPRNPGWPDDETLKARALFLERTTAGGLNREYVLETLRHQYRSLEAVAAGNIVLWFDACLFDQSMLAHILTCLLQKGIRNAELLCVDTFPGIEPFHGLGQLQPDQLSSLYDRRRAVTDAQFKFAVLADKAFATQDLALLADLSKETAAPLPWMPAAVTRWLEELPDPATGLGRLESLTLAAVIAGCERPDKIFRSVAAADTPPQFWGDTMLWAKINALAERVPPLVRIEGPGDRLPQWDSELALDAFRITAFPNQPLDPTVFGRG
jgi:hypothetical protein